MLPQNILRYGYAIIAFCVISTVSLHAEIPSSYQKFVQITEDYIAPLVPLMEAGKSKLPLDGLPSDHGEMADLLEAFSRPGLLLALWLQSEPIPQEARKYDFTREDIARWYRQALLLGTDRNSPEYWGDMLNYHQHGVEMSILTMSLEVAQPWLWDPLTQAEKDQVANWLGQMRGTARYWNNHLYFSILTIEFLRAHGYGQPGDQESIDYMFELLESMQIGGGWFKDGTNESYDYYNAYAFHTYGLWWVWKFGHTNPERAARWQHWAEQFIPDYVHFFASSGENVPYGRSITYRFNSLGVFGMAPHVGLQAVPYGEMRRICRKSLEFFHSKDLGQSQGALSVGWTDEFHGVAEPYTCPGSPYWAAKGLFMLTIPSDHPFWTDEEQPFPAERGDFVRTIAAPRFVLRGIGGEVELLNAGSMVSPTGAGRYGPWKWSKISYRTNTGFLVANNFSRYPLDATLTASPEGSDIRYGRQATIPLAAEDDHLAFMYALGNRDDGVNIPVRTDVFWNGPWILAVHKINTVHPTIFYHGSYSLGLEELGYWMKPIVGAQYAIVARPPGVRSVAIQGLAGFNDLETVSRRDEKEPRLHLTFPYHVTPVLLSEPLVGDHILAVLYWTGSEPAEGTPWTVNSLAEGKWSLSHAQYGDWTIENEALPAISSQAEAASTN